MKNAKKKLQIIVYTGFLLAMGVSRAFAQETTPLDGNSQYVVQDVLTIQGITGIVANILAIAISGIGFAGFIMMIVGSYQYLMSGGNSKGVEGGRNTITYALILF